MKKHWTKTRLKRYAYRIRAKFMESMVQYDPFLKDCDNIAYWYGIANGVTDDILPKFLIPKKQDKGHVFLGVVEGLGEVNRPDVPGSSWYSEHTFRRFAKEPSYVGGSILRIMALIGSVDIASVLVHPQQAPPAFPQRSFEDAITELGTKMNRELNKLKSDYGGVLPAAPEVRIDEFEELALDLSWMETPPVEGRTGIGEHTDLQQRERRKKKATTQQSAITATAEDQKGRVNQILRPFYFCESCGNNIE